MASDRGNSTPAVSGRVNPALATRAFDGSPAELAQFIVSAWKSTYAGKMAVPQWTGDYFSWQLRLDEPDSRRRIVAAYENGELAGVILYVPMSLELKGERFEAAQSSWLSVPVRYRGRGVARMLNEAALDSLREQGLSFRVGFGYTGSQASLGPGFWKRVQSTSHNVTHAGRVGFWARVLRPRQAAAWNVNRWQARLTGIAGPFIPLPRTRRLPGVSIRPVRATDVDRCLDLADSATRSCDLRLIWDKARLSRQLGLYGFSKALVAEIDGDVRGCIAFHTLPILGRTTETIGIIDLTFLAELPASVASELMNEVLRQLKSEGAVLALKLRTKDYPATTFLRWGWFCNPADSDVLLTWATPPQKLPAIHRLHVLWR